jgi:ribosomal protein L17
MRHRVRTKQLGRPTDQRIAILRSLVAGVLEHGHVTTTSARAKEAQPVIEKLITLGMEDSVANRRLARRWIPMGEKITTVEKFRNVTGEEPAVDKNAKPSKRGRTLKGSERRPFGERLIKKLFEEIGPHFVQSERHGGYLRLTKLGGEPTMSAKGKLTIRPARRGDNALMVKLEIIE